MREKILFFQEKLENKNRQHTVVLPIYNDSYDDLLIRLFMESQKKYNGKSYTDLFKNAILNLDDFKEFKRDILGLEISNVKDDTLDLKIDESSNDNLSKVEEIKMKKIDKNNINNILDKI